MSDTQQRVTLRIVRLDASSSTFGAELDSLRQRLSPSGNVVSPKGRELTQQVFGEPLAPSEVVRRVSEGVREQGLKALLHYSDQLDGGFEHVSADDVLRDPSLLKIPQQRLADAHAAASPAYLDCVRRIRENISGFQASILHTNRTFSPREGVQLDQRYVPLKRIGICVPGGAAAYPSTVLMTVVPAQAAGVEQIAIVAPPTSFGAYNADVLAACYELGINEVYPVGGAQAVAAMAYGVDGLPAVDKIVGPGNLFVALAKKFVYGQVDIDSIAGPSEVVVIADETTNPAYAAADMLAQAEHSPGASLLITWDSQLADRVEAELQRQLQVLSRSKLTLESLNDFGAFILVRDSKQAVEVTDLIAPEHLHIACVQPRVISDQIRNAGATFLGPFTPVALGDYAAGPSHVLPTGGTARWAAGLSANSFLRSGSVIEFSQSALADISASVCLLAGKEGLTAHRHSIEIRLDRPA